MSDAPTGAGQARGARNLYSNKIFRATHNSYSGDIGGLRGSIVQQLDSGIRMLELDVWPTNPIQVGHGPPGFDLDLVSHTRGNPRSNDPADWLILIKDWSDRNPLHDPVTILFDLKKDSQHPWSTLGELDDLLTTAFPPEKRFDSVKVKDDPTPAYDSLRGKIISLHNGTKREKGVNVPLPSEVLFFIPSFRAGDADTPSDFKFAGEFINFEAGESGASAPVTQSFLDEGFTVRYFDVDGRLEKLPEGITFAATDVPYLSPYEKFERENEDLVPRFSFKDVKWRERLGIPFHSYDIGNEPSIAINDDGIVVEVHKTEEEETNLFSRVGQLSREGGNPALTFFEPAVFLGVQGVRPMVAISGRNVCLVYKAGASVMCKTGTLNGKRIEWRKTAKNLGEGKTYPSVSMCRAGEKILVLVVMVGEKKDAYYTVGVMEDGKEPTWQRLQNASADVDVAVEFPDMEINDSKRIVMVWASENRVYSRIGILKEGPEWTVEWVVNTGRPATYPIIYDHGRRPSVALLADGTAIEIHRSANDNGLWSRTGRRIGAVAVWDVSEEIAQGDVSRIAAADGYVVEVHKDPDPAENHLYYTLGTYA